MPDHWGTQRLKYLARLNYGESLASEDREPGEVPVYGSNGQVGWHSRANTTAPVLIIGRKGSFGKVNYSDKPCFAIDTTFFVDERSAKVNLRWLYYGLQLLKLDAITQDSAVPGLSREFAHEERLPAISQLEQLAIATFLDHRTVHVDTLIARKTQQIRLLQEKRDVIISRFGIRGLNPDVKMTASGVEWLGEIPAHWTAVRSKFVFVEVDERSKTGDEELLTVSHITGVTSRSEKNVNMFMAETLEDYKKCKAGDLIVNTMWAWMGALGTAFQDGVVSPSYNVYRFRNSHFDPRYYDRLFRTRRFAEEIMRHSKGVWESRLRLYPMEFFQIRIPCPRASSRQRSVSV